MTDSSIESIRRSNPPWSQIIVIALLAAILLVQVGQAVRLPQWEYEIKGIEDAQFELEMAQMGHNGWELVFARRATSSEGAKASYEIIFRRPRSVFGLK